MRAEEQSLISKLLVMIADFQAKVAVANRLLQESLNIENTMYWRQAKLAQKGKLHSNGAGEYSFHGIGCWVKTKEFEIDWDYGFEGRTDGFDLWRLYCFAQYTSDDYLEFRDKELLQKIMNDAVAQNLILQPYRHLQDDLYYLTTANDS